MTKAGPVNEGYAPVSGTGWLFFETRTSTPLPFLYFQPDLSILQELGIEHSGKYLSLEKGETVAQSPTTQPQAAATSSDSGPIARVKSNANLRAGPGTNYATVGSLPQGAAVKILGKDQPAARWWKITDSNGAEAWVSAQLVEAANVEQVPLAKPPASAAPAEASATSQPARPKENWKLVADRQLTSRVDRIATTGITFGHRGATTSFGRT